jgi:hypothetical protein
MPFDIKTKIAEVVNMDKEMVRQILTQEQKDKPENI